MVENLAYFKQSFFPAEKALLIYFNDTTYPTYFGKPSGL